MRIIIIAGMLLLSLYSLNGQDIRFSAFLEDAGFEELVEEVEKQTNAHFFYKESLTEGIKINVGGEQLSLNEVLEKNLSGSGLSHYIDVHSNVFVLKGQMVTILPDPEPERVLPKAVQKYQPNTYAENQYFQGKAAESVREIVIGNRDSLSAEDQAVLYGKIADKESGEAMIGATIYLEELQTGTVTDVNGRYRMALDPGTYNARINCLGMRPLTYILDVRSDGALDIEMQTELVPIDEVVIEADRYQNTRGMQMGFTKLDIKKIKEIPVVMGERDLVKAVLMLPGIQSVGEGSSGLNVRGSSADQNMFYINKVPVYNTAHLFGFFSAFNPDIVKELDVLKSNVPVEYGGRLSSYFNIATRDGNKNKLSGRGGISPVTGHAAIEGPIIKGKHSFLLGARTTYSDWMLKRMENPDLRNSSASFYDLAGSLNLEPNDHNLIKVFGYYTHDKFRYSNLFSHEYANLGGSIDWRRRISPSLSSDLALVYSDYSFSSINQENNASSYEHDYRIGHYQTNLGFSWVPHSKHVVSFGGNLIRYDLDRGTIQPFGDESNRRRTDLGNENAVEGALYISDKFSLLPWLTLYGGLRYGMYSYRGPSEVYEYMPDFPRTDEFILDTLHFGSGQKVKNYQAPELRFAANFRTGAQSSVKVSYNRIRQYLFLLSNTISISPTDQWKLCDYHIAPPYVDHVSAGYYKDFPDKGFRTSLEVYLKKAGNVVEYRDGADFISAKNIEQEVLQGDQTAMGLELMLEKPGGKFSGWLSYAWSSSRILVNGEQPWEKINGGLAFPSNYDKPHSMNLVLNYRFSRRLSLSSTMVYSTGRPATYPASIYHMNNQEIVKYSDRNTYRIPDYFRTDLSLNLEGNLKEEKMIHSFWMLNFYNLTGRRNAYSVYFLSDDGKISGYKMSVFGNMIITVSWNFKFGNYATE